MSRAPEHPPSAPPLQQISSATSLPHYPRIRRPRKSDGTQSRADEATRRRA